MGESYSGIRALADFIHDVAKYQHSSIITRGSSMKGTGFPFKIPMFDAMRVTKEVHSIGPVIRKFVSHCLTIACAGEIRIFVDHGV